MSAVHDWIVPDWPAPATVRALITTRNDGASAGAHTSFNLGLNAGDEPAAVAANRAQLVRSSAKPSLSSLMRFSMSPRSR